MHHCAVSSILLTEELHDHCLINIVTKDDGMDLVCSTHERDDGIHLTCEEGLAAGLRTVSVEPSGSIKGDEFLDQQPVKGEGEVVPEHSMMVCVGG
jgi:hypothetical protein